MTDGYQAGPLRLAARVPGGLPFSVRSSPGVLLRQSGPRLVVAGGLIALWLAFEIFRWWWRASWVGSVWLPLVMGLLTVGYVASTPSLLGPLLAADEHGLWVQTGRPFRQSAIWLPWGAIARVHHSGPSGPQWRNRRRGHASYVVESHPAVTGLQGPLYCDASAADLPPETVLANLGRLAAGRCHVG